MHRKQGTIKTDFGAWARYLLPVLTLLLAASCVNDNGGDVDSGASKIIHGSFLVTIVEAFPPYWGDHTAISGRLYDGPSPAVVDWQEQSASRSCRVIKPEAPFCDPGCGSGSVCTVGGVCTAFPNSVHAGKVRVNGAKSASGATSFVMNPVRNAITHEEVYQPSEVQLSFPPYAEGDLLTFTAAGSADAPAFSLSARGPYLPRLLNDSIVLDGNSILLRWTPPGPTAGPSTFLAYIDISHHGGLKGTIECVAEDDGELEIAGSLVNQLKALGISGFPQIDVIRRTTASLDGHGMSLILEARILKYLTIPGLTSCREDEECPGDQTCQADFKCQ